MILKDSNNICFDNGEGRVQVYNWRVERTIGDEQPSSEVIVFEKTCSLRDHQIEEVIDADVISVIDYNINGKTKLFDVTKNKLCDLPDRFHLLAKKYGDSIRSRTF